MKDFNGIELKVGDVIDIHQTVNGQNLFVVLSLNPIDVRYKYDQSKEYEYDVNSLLAPFHYTGEVQWEIVGTIIEPVVNEVVEAKINLSEKDLEVFNAMPTFADGRKRLIEMITIKHEDNWQDVATPYDIAGEMADLVKHENTKYVVMFSLEFLEVMVMEKGISSEDILFITDYEIEGETASRLYDVTFAIVGKHDVMIDGKFNFDKIDKLVKKFTSLSIYEQEEINNSEINMKFNKLAVIGNPPYNSNSNGKDSVPLYHMFVESIIDNLNPDYFSMIIPSRWQVGGKGLDKHRERMMNDTRLKKIVHFAGSFSVFNTVEIAGGVNYFLYEKDYCGNCEFVDNGNSRMRNLSEFDVIIQDNIQYDIVKKVSTTNPNHITVFPQKPFGLRSDFSAWQEQGIKCLSVDRNEHFVDQSAFTDKNNILNTYKVVIGKANNDTNPNQFRVLAKPIVLGKGEICTETFLVIGSFDTLIEANNFASYVLTKFCRFMVLAHKNTQNMCKDTFLFVPNVGDYSMQWTDAELYKKYNLTRQEIAYIESKIKAI